jgi:peptide/nickel transport system permease protein
LKILQPKNKTVQRFLQNPLSCGGLIIFSSICLIAIFAPLLCTDTSPQAARQFSGNARQAPGHKIYLVSFPHTNSSASVHQIELLTSKAWKINRDKLLLVKASGQAIEILIPEKWFSIDIQHPFTQYCLLKQGTPYIIKRDTVYLFTISKKWISLPLSNLNSLFQNQSLQSFTFWLGTDGLGRDIYSRMILGSRTTVTIGIVAVLISVFLGVSLGLISGYSGGWIDKLLSAFFTLIWTLPAVLLAMVLAFVLGKGFWQIFVAIGLTLWVDIARVIRGQVLSMKFFPWVEAAKTLGFSSGRILRVHLLPNLLSTVWVLSASTFSTAVLVESGLSFLGIGVQPPTPSWGGLLFDGYTQIALSDGQWMALFPALAIVVLVVSLNLIGYGLRDAFDPKHENR